MELIASTFSFPDNEKLLFDYWLSRQEITAPHQPRNSERDREEISRLDGYIQALQYLPPSQQRDHNLAAAKECRQWTSWSLFRFHHLPEDIILNIFRIGTFGDSQTSPMNTFRVSQVCKQWREVAHEASSLWSSIAFDDNAYLISHFVERSRAYPLTIEINITDTEFDYGDNQFWPEEDHLDECMAILLPQAHRWRSFLCVTDNRDPIDGVINHLNNGQFPMLQSLELYQCFPHEDSLMWPPPMPLFASTPPALTSLNLTGVALDWQHLARLHLNLTEFSLSLIPLDEQPPLDLYHYILYTCRDTLRSLCLANSGPFLDGDFPSNMPIISFPNLQHFDFRGNNGNGYDLGYLSYLLSFMKFGPALRELTITHFMDETDFDSFIPDLSCRFSQVECLHIGHMPMTDLQVARWLGVFPKVRTLYLLGLKFQEAVLRVLNHPPIKSDIPSCGVLCPALKTLSPFWPEVALEVLISERERMGLPLTTLIWDVNLRKMIEATPYLQGAMIRMSYEGEVRDPSQRWVGPNVEDQSIDDEMSVEDEEGEDGEYEDGEYEDGEYEDGEDEDGEDEDEDGGEDGDGDDNEDELMSDA